MKEESGGLVWYAGGLSKRAAWPLLMPRGASYTKGPRLARSWRGGGDWVLLWAVTWEACAGLGAGRQAGKIGSRNVKQIGFKNKKSNLIRVDAVYFSGRWKK